ncbi:MAG: HesA/MoeB/ThiF family protein [Desulfobacteraceae bacterium]|nr:HesA/MoeB/ThiF family protein [Desulfobacteraceae bacterium]
MINKKQKEIHRLIQVRSRKVIDPAGRVAQILKDNNALKIANTCHCTVHEVYTEALRLGINPYRYIRNREIISIQEQLKLAESRVAVIGAGGLGGQAIMLLSRVGLGHLVVIDFDIFDETNQNRQALCSKKSLRKSKSKVAVDVVHSINPRVDITSYQVRLKSSNAPEVLFGSDVVVDALDNIHDRFTLEKITKKLGIPLVHGALADFEGWMMTIFPDDSGLKRLYKGEEAKKSNAKAPEAILVVPALIPSIIGTLQAMEVLKIILKRGKIFRNIMAHVDLEKGQLNEFVFENRNSLESS